jgi:DNA (cytosine-5)-methyltransferase 1
MKNMRVIDLFSGPGGLGEGFASLDNGSAFQIAVSAEMETSAHRTLTLRAFFRLALRSGDDKALLAYYAFCNSSEAPHPSIVQSKLWEMARDEARQLELGTGASDKLLDQIIQDKKLGGDDTILIGGPPCQAYSHAGRARNKGKVDYVPEMDKRHYLYREYLRVLAKTRPAIFVMENVKGILSSSPGGTRIFHEILNDLCDPVRAVTRKTGPTYVIHSLTTEARFEKGMGPDEIDPREFIIKAEEYGIPQARHRVILLGVREDINSPTAQLQRSLSGSVRTAISDLPRLRSQISPLKADSPSNWRAAVTNIGKRIAKDAAEADLKLISRRLFEVCGQLDSSLTFGGTRMSRTSTTVDQKQPSAFSNWVTDEKILVWLNHEAKSHMLSDLGRYLYASIFCEVTGRRPRGHKEFALPGLAPDHANWESGDFKDRFKVQAYDGPSSTMTSHIAKDGHSIIHPDPLQCRALTVREAARLQTFPDNYFFQGNRTEQFHQVGNAVPPLLANQIAKIVLNVLSENP